MQANGSLIGFGRSFRSDIGGIVDCAATHNRHRAGGKNPYGANLPFLRCLLQKC